ncbi:antibiotic biosynthesis monooxygenase [Winogradskyella maritima]|uniref:Antibiotic biosynthesis monooxygenase n=1 Tax=Winogradskyella maritima TaxID=1517766 RepID=A0ABV8AIG7_9FLAO|nr:antibiotic biosynthesis monooxygenase [Winogradskyella maritima]
MIARIWEGKTKIEFSDTYTQLIEERDILDYRKTEGFVKLTFLKRSDEEFTYFKLLTFWEDLDVVKNFTGPNFEEATAYKDDKKYLVDWPGSIIHCEVFAE